MNLDDVLAGDGLWLRDPGFFLVDSGSGRRYAAWRTGAGGRAASMPVLEDVATTGEDAFAATLDEAVINRPGPMVLGLPGARQDFVLFPDGSLELRTAALRTPGLDTLARSWPWPAVRWRFLTGARPRLPQEGERSLLDGWLPVVYRTWREDGLAWQQRSLVCSLHASGTEATDSPTSQLTVLATEFSVTNHTAAPCTARLWIETEPAVPLRLTLDGALVLDRPSDGEPRAGLLPVRGRLHSDGRGSLELRVARETPEGTDAGGPMRGFVCHEVQLAPGEGHAIALFIPGVELLTPDETARLKELRFATCIEAVRPHWHALSHAGARIEVPSPVLNRLFQANHWRTLSAMNPEPATGAWHLKTPFGAAAIPLDKVADIATLLDRRGEHEAAERLLLPALTNQGRRGPRGAFVDVRGAFCAQHPELPDPFGADRPAAQHGRLLSALANHVRLAPEPAFRERYLGNLLLAADWILRARLPDGRAAPAGIAPGQDKVRAGATDAA
ncbi:MAG: hypothetical protein KDM81_16800, partial [Verrucomicrobiae bacterium]|nr:hypothetical protein [Verrucomicrobiae bacterium]